MITFTNKVTDETPISMLTLGQLKKVLVEDSERRERERKERDAKSSRRYVYGLGGISQIFNCSIPTAHKLKSSVIKEAVSQQGRLIVTDVEKAMELFSIYKAKQ